MQIWTTPCRTRTLQQRYNRNLEFYCLDVSCMIIVYVTIECYVFAPYAICAPWDMFKYARCFCVEIGNNAFLKSNFETRRKYAFVRKPTRDIHFSSKVSVGNKTLSVGILFPRVPNYAASSSFLHQFLISLGVLNFTASSWFCLEFFRKFLIMSWVPNNSL